MEFKFNSTVFKNTAEDHKRLYGDKYDPNKPYPELTGNISIPKAQLSAFVEYLHWALRTELKNDSYLNDLVIPVRISGWTKHSHRGKMFLCLAYSRVYKSMMAAREAKEASELSTPEPTAQDAAASLAATTAGTVVQTQQDDIF